MEGSVIVAKTTNLNLFFSVFGRPPSTPENHRNMFCRPLHWKRTNKCAGGFLRPHSHTGNNHKQKKCAVDKESCVGVLHRRKKATKLWNCGRLILNPTAIKNKTKNKNQIPPHGKRYMQVLVCDPNRQIGVCQKQKIKCFDSKIYIYI